MPLQRCTTNGKSGWQYGNSGKCYPGPSGKKLAIKQGLAEGGGKFKAEMSVAGLLNDPDVLDVLNDETKYLASVSDYLDDKDETKAYMSVEERKKIPTADFAGPNRSFPISSQKHLDAAVKLMGRKSPAEQQAIKKKIKEIAARKNLKLPASWTND